MWGFCHSFEVCGTSHGQKQGCQCTIKDINQQDNSYICVFFTTKKHPEMYFKC